MCNEYRRSPIEKLTDTLQYFVDKIYNVSLILIIILLRVMRFFIIKIETFYFSFLL